MTRRTDVLVAGAGSGGFGAALAAARRGLSVVIVEKSNAVGGNANRCGVNNWEPVCGATGYPYEIWRRLNEMPSATGIYGYGRHCVWQGTDVYPGGEHVLVPGRSYADTMVRHGARSLAEDEAFVRANLYGVVFEPRAYEALLWQMLGETGRCRVLLGRAVREASVHAGRVTAVRLDDGERYEADAFIDATGDGELCGAAGCALVTGQESREAWGEPSAPDLPNDRVNGVTLMFRITRKAEPGVDALPADLSPDCDWAPRFPLVVTVEYPNGDRNVNMLPTMEGRDYLNLLSGPGGHEAAYRECRRRLMVTWHHLQSAYPEFHSWTIRALAADVGVRESRRVVCEKTLTEHDILKGISEADEDGVIAIADHALDRHGEQGGAMELKRPFGIPFSCLVPRGFSNVLVACRAAGFSSIAASSCRLSRTMMQLGQAAGTACAIASRDRCEPYAVARGSLWGALREDGVQLSWPMKPGLMERDRSARDRSPG